MTLGDFRARTIDGRPQPLSAYLGKTVLIVNVASACGYTPQYRGLEALYRKHRDRGFVVLGFPCNQFGGQEPGSEDVIAAFCARRYDVTFPLFSKIAVNGPNAHPLFQWLKTEKTGLLGTGAIKWNFTKFLVGPDGSVLQRYGPAHTPEAIERDLVLGTAEP